mmetsp:Transcript_12256/g.19338  ORF Transcript_12256/g.19338 Transcript_12256/m.19338 type:complete len:471 (+) Transcript_12256:163-1575(+)
MPRNTKKKNTENGNNDDDLNDILDTYKSNGNDSEMAPLNLESLSEGNLDVPVKRSGSGGGNPCYNLLSLCCLYMSYCCEFAPKCCCGLAMLAIVVPAYFIVMTLLNPTEQFGIVANDYTSITSQYDLSVGKIDHWCLQGDNDSCMCEDPLQPQPRGEFRAWTKAHEFNKAAIKDMIDAGNPSPDIAFLGASVVEEMDGRWFGEERDDPNLQSIGKMFKKHFSKAEGGDMDGVALGVAGDTSPSILWRLMNGEMPATFDPKIWWIEVGMNDLGRAQCSEEVVVLGVLRVVEELLKKPNAKIVINSLFPMADLRGGLVVGKKDFDDAATDRMKHAKRMHEARAEHTTRTRPTPGGRRNLRWFGGGGGFRSDNKKVQMDANVVSQKKYTTITHHERKLPLWTSISAVNTELKKFASKNERVSFFDATSIFAEREEGSIWTLKKEMISVRGHPSPAGFEIWGGQVRDFAKKLLQ